MIEGTLAVIGGIGLFLLGMTLLSDGLRSISGDLLRAIIARFTRSPWTGALTGLVATICVQSSSVITVMSVGFVGAGLLTFPESLGIIYGANVGSTFTGWFIVFLGLRVSLTQFFLPLVFVGAALRLFARGRWISIGNSIAGFSLVFLGITQLQAGMELVGPNVGPESLPGDTYFGRVLLVLLGMVIVVVMQSSGAAMAVTLSALHAGNVSLAQACYLVVGMNVGTTATAALAALAGNFNARRTAAAHVLFNVLTAVLAFGVAPAYLWLVGQGTGHEDFSHAPLELVVFHTSFNVIGTLIALPLTHRFAAIVTRLFPPSHRDLARRLEPSFLNQPEVALDAVVGTLVEVTESLFKALRRRLQEGRHLDGDDNVVDDSFGAIRDTTRYLHEIRSADGKPVVLDQRTNAMHVVDHLSRLAERCKESKRFETIHRVDDLKSYREQLVALTRLPLLNAEREVSLDVVSQHEAFYRSLDEALEGYRQSTIEQLEAGELSSEETLNRLDAFRWLRRVAFHAWRITFHLHCVRSGNGAIHVPDSTEP